MKKIIILALGGVIALLLGIILLEMIGLTISNTEIYKDCQTNENSKLYGDYSYCLAIQEERKLLHTEQIIKIYKYDIPNGVFHSAYSPYKFNSDNVENLQTTWSDKGVEITALDTKGKSFKLFIVKENFIGGR